MVQRERAAGKWSTDLLDIPKGRLLLGTASQRPEVICPGSHSWEQILQLLLPAAYDLVFRKVLSLSTRFEKNWGRLFLYVFQFMQS